MCIRDSIRILEGYLNTLCDWVKSIDKEDNYVDAMLRMDDQVWYSTQQRKNKKTIAALSSWFDKEWAIDYIHNILFDLPK